MPSSHDTTRASTRLLASLILAAIAGCGRPSKQPETSGPAATASAPAPQQLVDEIPSANLEKVIRAHLDGLGAMERYEYRRAGKSFREVRRLAPGWIPGTVNLALALLNDTGTQEEAARTQGGQARPADYNEALELLEEVLVRDPSHLHAHFCRGLIRESAGKVGEAHEDFKFVAEHDPNDAHAWYKVAITLTSKAHPERPAAIEEADLVIELLKKALDRDPYLVAAIFKLQSAYGWAGDRAKQKEMLDRWRRYSTTTNAAGPGDMDLTRPFYGGFGRYATVIDPFDRRARPPARPLPPRFVAPRPIAVNLEAGERWVRDEDFRGELAVLGRARSRFGASVVTLDADGDGKTDLYLPAGLVGPEGPHDALLLSQGDGKFEDVSRKWGLPRGRPSLGVAAADFDADRNIDLFLTTLDGPHLLRNVGASRFEDVTEAAGLGGSKALGLTARWLDLDQDGDLDLYVLNHTDLEHARDAFGDRPVPGAKNAAFRNVGKPSPIPQWPQDNWAPLAVALSDVGAKRGLSIEFAAWPEAEALLGPAARNSAIAALDVDDDRDLDLVLAADDQPIRIVLNDRLGLFHALDAKALDVKEPLNGLLVADFNNDGKADLAAPTRGGGVLTWQNATDVTKSPRVIEWKTFPDDAKDWRSAQAVDLDLDSSPDLIGLTLDPAAPGVAWARNAGSRFETQPLGFGATPEGYSRIAGYGFVDVAGDALPDLVVLADGHAPAIAVNQGNGNHWLALNLGGRWRTSFDHMRTNPHGLGTKVTAEGQGLLASAEHTTPQAGLTQAIAPLVLGLGSNPSVDLLRLRWPDGTMQCELNTKADTRIDLSEYNRKTGSCPVLFTWNGSRFVCLGDFLGGGGLGYLVSPGVYGQPDRDESVAISPDQLKAVDGVLRLAITEPMDEVAYLDKLELVAVDRPPGVDSTPDERFAPEGPRPTGETLAWSKIIRPRKAVDLKGRDVLDVLKDWDRRTANHFERLVGWVGYAEEHGIVLDFGDRLSGLAPETPLVLALAGWVEYPYSQTNFAAATAGVALRPPSVERRNPDGSWTTIVPHAGYPAGLPRMTTLDLTGRLGGPDCVIRLRTNMECYWDQAFLAIRDHAAEKAIVQSTLRPSRASLGHRGYTREVSPDGRLPLLYDYDYVDPAPLALMEGELTRHGDVLPLLDADDDHLCLVGPGDEVRLEFSAASLPPLKEGWTRSFVLKAVGYCKDADPFTATSDAVGPLPWKGMPEFPFVKPANRPVDAPYSEYLRTYQTRPAGRSGAGPGPRENRFRVEEAAGND